MQQPQPGTPYAAGQQVAAPTPPGMVQVDLGANHMMAHGGAMSMRQQGKA